MSDDQAPVCPGCKQPAPEGTYPPGIGTWWWCSPCLKTEVIRRR